MLLIPPNLKQKQAPLRQISSGVTPVDQAPIAD